MSDDALLVEARETNARLHRRVQEMESWVRAILHVGLDTCDNLRRSASAAWASHVRWKKEYLSAVERLVEAKVPDHVDGHGPMWRMRRLDVLIERIISERDELRREATREGVNERARSREIVTLINSNLDLERWYPMNDGFWERHTYGRVQSSKDGRGLDDVMEAIDRAKGFVVFQKSILSPPES